MGFTCVFDHSRLLGSHLDFLSPNLAGIDGKALALPAPPTVPALPDRGRGHAVSDGEWEQMQESCNDAIMILQNLYRAMGKTVQSLAAGDTMHALLQL